MLIELAPIFLSLPTLLLSLTLTTVDSNLEIDPNNTQVIDDVLLKILQSMLIASFALVCMCSFIKYVPLTEVDSENKFIQNDSAENIKNSNSTGNITNNIIYLWIPMVFLFLSDCYLGPLRLISLLAICQLVNKIPKKSSHRSFQVENNYSVSNSSFSVLFYKKFQLYIILGLAAFFDIIYDLCFSQKNLNRHVFGYLFFLVPFMTFTRPFLNEKEFTDNRGKFSLTKFYSFVMVLSFLIIIYFYLDKYNFKMLLVSFGSLVILLFSQFENGNLIKLKLQNFATDLINSDLVIRHYRFNYLILNLIVLMIAFLNKSIDPKFSYDDPFKNFVIENMVSFGFNVILLFLLRVDSNEVVTCGSRSDLKNKYEMTKVEPTVTFFTLFIQLVNSEESKSIFNFLLLNVAFMFIQLLYSFRSRSLSLLSDSLHMLLDCTSLFLGLMASVIAKNNVKNPNEKYPFGLNRIGTLSGFTNGSLLLGIVFGIFNESIQRIFNPVVLENTTELLLVSFLGFLVNLVGIFAFNHGHDHSHSHSHGHSHGHNHTHDHSDGHSHKEKTQNQNENDDGHTHTHHEEEKNKEHRHEHEHEHEHEHGHGHGHEHEHENFDNVDEIQFNLNTSCEDEDHDNAECLESHHDDDNMHGIFLHIMADTLGSVGVIISTIIIKLTGWDFVDPLTSMLIATLILISAVPLLKSSSSNLLLSLNDETEEELKYHLSEVLNIPGVKSYTTPRFLPQDGPNSKLVGYLHVQYYRTENSLSIKTKIDRIFQKSSVVKTFYLQLENEVDECWCRKEGIFSTY